MLLLSSCCLAACVDSKYDLSDVNTDDAVMGESWVAPLGTGYVTSDDVVNVEKVPSIREVDGAYVMIYDGEMKIKGMCRRTLRRYRTGILWIFGLAVLIWSCLLPLYLMG